jgi:hypothetical protein
MMRQKISVREERGGGKRRVLHGAGLLTLTCLRVSPNIAQHDAVATGEERLSSDILDGGASFKGGDVLENHFDDVFIAEFGIDHDVVEPASGPLGSKIVANELGPFRINFLDQFLRFFPAFPE